jgi:hypothetical protein
MQQIGFKVLNILFGIAFLWNIETHAQKILLQNEKTGKMVELDLRREFSYVLKSDSVLYQDSTKKSLSIPVESARAVEIKDSLLILQKGYQLLISDLVFIEQLPRKYFIAQRNSSPFLLVGLGILTRGLIMIPEGFESKNALFIPAQILGGGLIAAFSSIPFWKKPVRYNMSDWTLVQVK